MKTLLKIGNLVCGYAQKESRKVLVNDFSAEIKEGERIALLGLNGSGKSTLLRSIQSSIPTLEGKILLKGKEISHYDEREKAKLMASVQTQFVSPGQIKVIDLVSFGRYPYTDWMNRSKGEDDKHVKKALKQAQIFDLKDRFVDELSDGERQKVLLAVAMAQDTPLLLLDEPTSHLDVKNKVAMMKLIKDHSEEHSKSILFTTHDLNLAKKVATRVWLLHDSKIIDDPIEIFLQEEKWKFLMEDLDEELRDWL